MRVLFNMIYKVVALTDQVLVVRIYTLMVDQLGVTYMEAVKKGQLAVHP